MPSPCLCTQIPTYPLIYAIFLQCDVRSGPWNKKEHWLDMPQVLDLMKRFSAESGYSTSQEKLVYIVIYFGCQARNCSPVPCCRRSKRKDERSRFWTTWSTLRQPEENSVPHGLLYSTNNLKMDMKNGIRCHCNFILPFYNFMFWYMRVKVNCYCIKCVWCSLFLELTIRIKDLKAEI